MPNVSNVDNPESNSFPLFGSLYPVTILPTLILIGFGENALSAELAAPGLIKTVLLLRLELVAGAVMLVVLAAVTAALVLIPLREGRVCSIFGLVIMGWYGNQY